MNQRTKPGTSKQAASDRKAVFVEAYIANGGNATEAAKTAGYSPKTAYSQGQRLLKDVEIKQRLEHRQEKLARKYELTTEAVIAELAKIVHFDPRRALDENGAVLPVHLWPDDVAAAIASFEVSEERDDKGNPIGQTKKLRVFDKNAAIEKAMKHLGLFEKDNLQRSGVQDLTDERLDQMLARLAKEVGVSLH